jgi:5-hydroxyisourate hydrolase
MHTSATVHDHSRATERLKDLAGQIPTSHPTRPASRTPMAQRPFITCHVLDTVAGKPGAGIDVKLKLISPAHATTSHWTAKTNSDGRVPAWTSSTEINDIVAKVKSELGDGEQMVWSLTFDTEAYFGKGKTFWPEVELRFAAKKEEEHYHVPLLLGPWSYTTYRGS